MNVVNSPQLFGRCSKSVSKITFDHIFLFEKDHQTFNVLMYEIFRLLHAIQCNSVVIPRDVPTFDQSFCDCKSLVLTTHRYDTIRKGISEKVKTSSPIIQWLFKVAYDHKLESLYAGRDTPLFNFLIFRKIAKATGGKLRACLSGGAPLSKESQEHFRVW